MKKRVYIILRFFYRLIKYKAERNKRVREIGIIIRQLLGLRKIKRDTPHLIIFFIPGLDYFTGRESISGGLISIISMVEESKKIFDKMNNIEVICCTYPNSHLLYKLKTFKNNTQIFSYSLVERYFNKVQSVMLHLPEIFTEDFNNRAGILRFKGDIIHLNILNQNINLMPDETIIHQLKNYFQLTTMTTAHKKYSTHFFSEKYKVPVHQISVWISSEDYKKSNYLEKEQLILFSPDNPELTSKMMSIINNSLPHFKTEVISGLSYEDYKNRIRDAKFIITTGEGLDAYFIESYFSGSVGLAIKNKDFFDEKYLGLEELLEEDELASIKLVALLKKLDDQNIYRETNNSNSLLLKADYSKTNYENNLLEFYKRYRYTLII